jgi:hypothetical protein
MRTSLRFMPALVAAVVVLDAGLVSAQRCLA